MKTHIKYYSVKRKYQRVQNALKVDLIRATTTLLFILALYLFATNTLTAQSGKKQTPSFDIEKYEDNEDAMIVSVSETMIRLATKMAKVAMKATRQNIDTTDAKMSAYVNGKELKKINEITNAIKKIDVISTDDKKLWATIESDLKKYIKKHKAQKIIARKTKEYAMKVYTISGNQNKINALLMDVEPKEDENTLLQVLGDDMEIEEIVNMAKSTNISGASFLIKLDEKNIVNMGAQKTASKKILHLKSYDEIVVSAAFEVKLVKGKEGTVTIEASEKKLTLIEVTCDGKKLNIGFKKSGLTLRGKERMVVTVPYQTLRKITVSGASKIKGNDGFSQDKLKLNASGASSIKLDKINTKNLQIDASGAAKLQLRGKASVLSAKLSGACEISAYDFLTKQSNFIATGASKIKITTTEKIIYDASGVAKISYKGSPKKEGKTTGLSSIKKVK